MTDQNDIEILAEQIRLRTENFFGVHGLCCSEAIMYVINKGLSGGLDDETVLKIGNGFCGGMGGGEGTCGALTGAVSVMGLFLSPHCKKGLSKKKARLATKELQDRFKEKLASISCNDLTQEFLNQRKARVKNCQKITGIGAEISATIILKNRPDLIDQADRIFLAKNDSKLKALAGKFCSLLS
nr:C_GCAxxG_C_C family protein [Desulfobulbaceae bacterium]